jgi:hypothetical protein
MRVAVSALLSTPSVVDQPPLLVPLIGRGAIAGRNEDGLPHPGRFTTGECYDVCPEKPGDLMDRDRSSSSIQPNR